jgi:hypothetical protein
LTIKIYNRQGRTQRGCTGCTCIPPDWSGSGSESFFH